MKTIVGFLLLQLIYSLCLGEVQSEIGNETSSFGEELGDQSWKLQDAANQQETNKEDIHAVLREISAQLAEQNVDIRELKRENQGKEMKL